MTWKCTNTAKGDNKLYSDAKGVVPSLDLRFAEGKTLNDYMTGQNLITFSRSSIGTYVDENGIIQTATTNTPRFDHDPTTGESLGLLVEESRTNINDYSVDTSNWSNTSGGSVTSTPNAGIAPDNTNTATLIDASAGSGFIGNNAIYNSGTEYTFSAYFKAGTGDEARIVLLSSGGSSGRWNGETANNIARIFDLTNGTSSTDNNTVDPTDWSIVDAGNGWWRCSITATATASFTSTQQLGRNQNAGTTIYGWGWQIEEGSFPTSYIPTAGSTVTRNADVASITGSNFSNLYNTSEGTLYAEAKGKGRGNDSSNSVFQADDGSLDNRILLTNDDELGVSSAVIVGAVPNYYTPSTFTTGVNKNTIAYASAGGISTSLNGSTVITDTPTLPTVNAFRIGSNASGTSNQTIKRLTYFPERLPDSTLQTITTP